MKKMLLVFLLCVSYATVVTAANTFSGTTESGIVTQDVATTLYWSSRYTLDQEGEIVVCPGYADLSWRTLTCVFQNQNSWKRMANMAPTGKEYVGFRIVSSAGGYRQLEIYFK
jgi:hypothetical protein